MKKYVYSAANNAFYPTSMKEDYVSGNCWPTDGVECDEDIFTEYTKEPPTGKVRIVGKDGYPEWGDIPPPTHEELVAEAEAEKQRRIDQANDYINRKQWPGKAAIGRLKGDELTQYNLWLDYLDALEEVGTTTAPNITWPTPPAA
ncbi:tail fiber assembly protein [Escherichia coli]|nr:tail fiber assembly protein [Escherichia coli]